MVNGEQAEEPRVFVRMYELAYLAIGKYWMARVAAKLCTVEQCPRGLFFELPKLNTPHDFFGSNLMGLKPTRDFTFAPDDTELREMCKRWKCQVYRRPDLLVDIVYWKLVY